MKFFLLVFLFFSFSSVSQIYLKPTIYPSTPGNADGAFKVELMGYPGLVSYRVGDPWNFIETYTDSLSGYDYSMQYAEIFAIAMDSITGDTIAHLNMRNPGLCTSLNMSYLNQPQTISSCDGVLQVNFLYDTIAYTGNMSMTYGPFQIGGIGTWPNLCAEEGILNISNGIGFYVDMNVILEPLNVINNTSFNASVFSTVSSEDSCTTTSYVEIVGSTEPYSYSWDFGLFASVDTIPYLCPGFHNIRIVDNLNDTLSLNFVSVDSSNAYINYVPTPVIDTISFNTSNCSFDYNSVVDSIETSFYDVINDTTFYFEMSIWQSGVLTVVSDTIICTYSQTGYNLFSLSLYCQQKAGSPKIFQIVDIIDMSVVSTINQKKEEIVIYPNPTTTFINIKYPNYHHSILTDMRGNEVLYSEDNLIDLKEISSGVYFITVFDLNSKFTTKKLIIN